MREIKHKSILITGASSGIGTAIAQTLVEGGANVALMARREEKLQEVVASLPEGGQSLLVVGDVTSEADVRNGIAKTVETFGALDGLVNNAGYGAFKPLHEMGTEEFDGMVAVNLKGVFLATKYSLEQMYKQGKGGIL